MRERICVKKNDLFHINHFGFFHRKRSAAVFCLCGFLQKSEQIMAGGQFMCLIVIDSFGAPGITLRISAYRGRLVCARLLSFLADFSAAYVLHFQSGDIVARGKKWPTTFASSDTVAF
ncbi:MAG: hypothetical protein PVH04_09600 [Gammaproteobacteria bacterium]